MRSLFILATIIFGFLSETSAQFGLSRSETYGIGPRRSRSGNLFRGISDFEYNHAKAAGRKLTHFYRMECSIGYTLAPATFEHHYYRPQQEFSSQPGFDTAYSVKGSLRGIYITNTFGIPLTTLNDHSAMIVTYGASLRLNRFLTPVMKFDGHEEAYKVSTMDWGGILTLDYKSGAEAMLDRGLRTCFTIGAGIEPTYFYSDIEVNKGTGQFVVTPVLKAEFGLAFAKQALKIRLSANPTKPIVYLERTGDWYHSNLSPSDFRLSGRGQYSLSLAWMLFAHKWSEAAWYR